jgi:hypothetical protein
MAEAYKGADKSLAFSISPTFITNNTFITSKFIVLYMSDLNFIIVKVKGKVIPVFI